MKKAVILFNLGGPDKLENVEPFLFNLFYDPAILNLPSFIRYPLAKLIANRRTPTAKNIYKELGGSSPILKLTEEQAFALETNLNENDNLSEYKCFVVMRCWHPRAENVVKEVMLASEQKKVLLPVYLEPADIPAKLQYQLAGIQHLELYDQNNQNVLADLVNGLSKRGITLGGEVSSPEITTVKRHERPSAKQAKTKSDLKKTSAK